MVWNHQNIKQLLLDLSMKVTESAFNGISDMYSIDNADWKSDIGLDSIEIMQLASAANSFFNLFQMDNAPYLLSSSKVDEWVQYIYLARQETNQTITFHTSGTTGDPKTISHQTSFLDREIEFLATVFSDATHIIPLIPSYSIYGFLTTIGLPAQLNIPLLYPSKTNWSHLPARALVVATPFHWNLLINSLSSNSPCYGLSSTSPLSEDLFRRISAKEILLTELYGSTETAGIAYRQHWQDSFTLFPYFRFASEKNNEIEDCKTKAPVELVDNIEKRGINTFTLAGRKDQKVKIAGMLADLDEIKKIIGQIQGIEECRH